MIVDPVVYGPDDKPAATLKGWLEGCARSMPVGREYWTFVMPPAPLAAPLLELTVPAPDLAAINYITLRQRVRRRASQPDTDVLVFNFADTSSITVYQDWLFGEDKRRARGRR